MTALVNAVRLVDAFPGAHLVDLEPDDLPGHAFAYAQGGYEVLPLNGKLPRTSHGVKDATADLDQIATWWTRWPTANIGGRVPKGVMVVDLDPRNGALEHLERLEAEHGPIVTRTSWSGRGDGGRHFWFRHPGGNLSSAQLPPGWDLKTHAGYVVLPPSIHPDTGGRYRWDDPSAPIATMPGWLLERLRPPAPLAPPARPRGTFLGSGDDSIVDWYTATHTWDEILVGWTVVSGNGDEDGSRWRRPNKDTAWSASIRHGCLFVYSTSTSFDATDVEKTHGYTKFRAWAVLEHGGDLSAAARAARELRKAAA